MPKKGKKTKQRKQSKGLRSRFGQRLRDLRYSMDMTQESLANETDLPQSYISDLENGYKGFTTDRLEQLAKALHIDVYQLFLFDTEADKAGEKILTENLTKIIKNASITEKKNILSTAQNLIKKK